MREFLQRRWEVAIVAIVALGIVVIRAIHQSVTWDEANTFLLCVWLRHPAFWIPYASNHVLYTMLEALSVGIFGTSGATIRIPAILGASLYVATCAAFCARYIRGRKLAAVSLSCLLLNPFVLDYLVAARGYGLAVAFLIAAAFLLGVARDVPGRTLALCATASTAIGLSIASNFSVGIVGVTTLAVFGAIFFFDRRRVDRAALAAALALPAPIVVLTICASALTQFSSSAELVYGAQSIGEMLGSIVANTFDGPSPYIVNPGLVPVVRALGTVAPYLIGIVFATAVVMLVREKSLHRTPALPLFAILAIALPVQVVFAAISHSPLPMGRTILFAAPFATLVVSLAVAATGVRVFIRVATVTLAAVALFFAASSRTYFREWAFDQNVARVYTALREIESRSPGLTVVSDKNYVSSLDFYRTIDPAPNVPAFIEELPGENGSGRKAIYVLAQGADDAFIDRRGLKVVYAYPQDDAPDIEIAVKPEIAIPELPTPPGT